MNIEMDNQDEDIMSKVMKRSLGGSSSSCESSPEKRLKLPGHSSHVLLKNENSLNKMNSFIQGLISVKSPNFGDVRDTEGKMPNFGDIRDMEGKSPNYGDIRNMAAIDEIDGEVNKIDSNFSKKNSVNRNETNNITYSHCVYEGVEEEKIVSSSAHNTYIENQKDAANKMLKNSSKNIDGEGGDSVTDSYGKYEYVLSGDDARATKPRIEMFSESDSNSNSNPFIISSFQSLNSENIDSINEDVSYKPRKETDNRIVYNKPFDMTSSSSAENSQKFQWSEENLVEETNSASVSYKENTSFCDLEKVGSDKGEHKSERSDTTVVQDINLSRLKNESLVFNDLKLTLHNKERSENENEKRNNNIHTDESTIDSFIDSRSETGRSESECEEMKENKGSEDEHNSFVKNTVYHTDFREVKTENLEKKDNEVKGGAFSVSSYDASVEKSTMKKSRKQYFPKRVKKIEVPENNNSDFGLGLEAPEVYLEKDEECCSDGNREKLIAERDVDLPDNEGVEQRKPEKSRKQFKPKRVEQSENGDNQGLVHENVNEEVESEKSVGVESKNQKNETFEEVREKDTENDIDKKYKSSVLNFSSSSHRDDSVDSFTRGSDVVIETDKDIYCTESPWQKTVKDSNVSHFPSLNTSPFYYGFSPNLDLISSLTPGLLQGPSESSGTFALSENGPENLEVIRQLREIRCNRYRKISMAEKREIAGYASAHGVSQAAAYYNVSKSAVSMWTKLDFSNIDEDSGRQKKNCMIGNEKFEALCNKVKSERENKFKGMTKQDKFEVSRYAKLVGVREMARCLDVALGTVSGWMRQFPYKVETESSDSQLSEVSASKTDRVKEDSERKDLSSFGEQNDKTQKRRKSNDSFKSNKKRKQKNDEHEALLHTTIQKDDTMYVLPAGKTDPSDTEMSKDVCNRNDTEKPTEALARESDQEESLQKKDELDKMIAETWQKPDFDKCFEDIKDMIKDSPLEGDDFFRSLFERVISCRADKYKTLKPSEKLEVVRYAKRVGVRKVAKILGLATGTLSGWNTKYQSSLGITDPNIDMSNKSDLLVSYLSPDKGTENSDSSSYSQNLASLDNTEKSEVTAVKLLFKDKFPILLNKIRIAKEVKFRNITTEEKIEFVKCSKLVGIRPTARVFNIPIGTLSGWITKYTKTLHPAYHVDVEQDSSSNSQDGSSQFSPLGIYNPNVVGRTAGPLQVFHGLMNVNPAWQPMTSFTPSGPGVGLNIFPQFPNLSTSSSSPSPSLFPIASSLSSEFSSPISTSESVSENKHSRDSDSDKEFKQELTSQRESWIANESENGSEILNSLNSDSQSGANRHVTVESSESQSESHFEDNFEKEAREMAKRYLTATYEKMGIPIV